MPLSQTDIRKVQRWIQDKASANKCSICGSNNWSVSNEIAFLLTADNNTGRINHLDGTPLVVVTCRECGHVMPFSAIVVGVWRP